MTRSFLLVATCFLLVCASCGGGEGTAVTEPVPDGGGVVPAGDEGGAADADAGTVLPDEAAGPVADARADSGVDPGGAPPVELPPDKVAPTVRIEAPLDGETVTGDVGVSVEAADDRGVERVVLELDGAELATLWSEPYTWTWDTSALPGGSYRLGASAYDEAGNTAKHEIGLFVRGECSAAGDCPPQSVRIVTPVAGARVCGKVTVEATATDDVGIARMEFEVDGVSIGVDEESPYQRDWDTTAAANGEHTVKVTARDTAGQTAFATIDVEVRNEAGECDNLPTVRLTSPEDDAFVHGVVEVKANASDDVGVTGVQFFVDNGLLEEDTKIPYGFEWDTSEFEEGAHTLKAIAEDTSEQKATHQIQVTIDRTPPSVVLSSPPGGAVYADAVPLAAQPTDNFRVARVEFTVEGAAEPLSVGAAPWETTLDATGLSSGEHEVKVVAYDGGGLTAEELGSFVLDRPPVVSFAAPRGGATITGDVEVQVEADDDLGLDRVELYVDEAYAGELGWDGTYDWTPKYVAGERVLRAVAYDGRGQEGSAEVTVVVDHPLEVEVRRCEAGDCERLGGDADEVWGEVELRVEARDDGGPIEGVELFVDGDLLGAGDAVPFEQVWDTTEESEGEHVLRAVAKGTGGAEGSAEVTVRVNNCDRDHDGYLAESEACGGSDCDDGDRYAHPLSESEHLGDGVDTDCDGHDGTDRDGDGYAGSYGDSLGDDCDDGDATVHPCADDLPGDGKDHDCDEDGDVEASCDDCEACTEDAFDGTGCTHEPVAEGGECDDGDACTEGEMCTSGACGGGAAVVCDDGDPCTVDACGATTGCTTKAGNDGAECPGGVCRGGECCEPSCGESECGDDGCGGSCGSCGEGLTCAGGECVDQPEGFVMVPAGEFLMGSPSSEAGRGSDEGAQRTVRITRAFFLKATEVTQGEWEALMGSNPSSFSSCGDDCPVESVSWWESVEYCNALSRSEGLPECYEVSGSTVTVKAAGGNPLECEGYRLPTEAEWEYAYRAGTATAFYNGGITYTGWVCGSDPNLDEIAWYCGNSGDTTHSVGAKEPNAWGLYDMAGNVWEWAWDRYGEYESRPNPDTDPVGPGEGSYRVYRGGSWNRNARYCRAASRNMYDPGYRFRYLGLRPARSASIP